MPVLFKEMKSPGRLWAEYSLLKTTIFVKKIEAFLKEFPDQVYLHIKVAMIFGIARVCRERRGYKPSSG